MTITEENECVCFKKKEWQFNEEVSSVYVIMCSLNKKQVNQTTLTEKIELSGTFLVYLKQIYTQTCYYFACKSCI